MELELVSVGKAQISNQIFRYTRNDFLYQINRKGNTRLRYHEKNRNLKTKAVQWQATKNGNMKVLITFYFVKICFISVVH